MKLKKANAVLAILSEITLLIHIGYTVFAFLTFYYNPMLKTITALPFIILTCFHAVCGMCAVFIMGDGTSLHTYPKQNIGTLLQRISAAFIFPLLLLHLRTYDLLKYSAENANWILFALMILVQTVFYGVTLLHIAVSFSKAFITLGMLGERTKQKRLDRIAWVVCSLIGIAASIVVTRTELLMFLPK